MMKQLQRYVWARGWMDVCRGASAVFFMSRLLNAKLLNIHLKITNQTLASE